MARARVVAVLNAAIRIAWVISLVWTSRTCWPGLTWPSGSRAGMARWVSWAVSRSASAARRPAVSPSWSLLVISTDTPGGGDTASSRAASVAARARSYRALAATDAALLEAVSPPPGVSVLITNNDHDGLTAGLRAAEADLDTA